MMVDKEVVLKDIDFDFYGERFALDECEHVDVGVGGRMMSGRLFYKKEANHVYFIGLWVIGYSCEDEDIWLDKEYTEVEVAFTGSAKSGEITHLHMGDERTGNYGYLYYPDTESMIAMVNGINDVIKNTDQGR